MCSLRVTLFHRFEISHADRALAIQVRRAQELLAYLILHRSVPHQRDVLADRIWDEACLDQARPNLRKTLWQLQAALNETRATGDYLLVDGEWIQWNPCIVFWADAVVVEENFAQIKDKQGRDLSPAEANTARAIIDLYRGELLEGWSHAWCLYARQRYRFMVLTTFDKYIEYCESHGAYEEGIANALHLLRYDPARERTHRHLMRLHYLSGNRSAALQQYVYCTNYLRAELDVSPSETTRTLHERIRRECLYAPAEVKELQPGPEAQLLAQLEQMEMLRAGLSVLEKQMGAQILSLREAAEPSHN